ncbi:MAG: NUDIX hydrolase [Bacteroidota bacterium]
MYKKIYINGTPLFLLDKQTAIQAAQGKPDTLFSKYNGKTKHLFNYIDMLEKSQRFDAIYLYSEDVTAMYRDFKSLYKRIRAAGGVVYNPKGEVLVIYRRKSWDLPKGKIDPGEKKREAAVREVMEETGLQGIQLHDKLTKTYHTYKLEDGRRVLKVTFWYHMTADAQALTPQVEEDIEEARWANLAEFLDSDKKVYGNILDVLMQSLKSGFGSKMT